MAMPLPITYVETCERCGRSLESGAYILNGRTLCKSCLEEEKRKWELVTGKPMGPGQRVSLTPIQNKKKVSFITSVISEILYALHLKERPAAREVIIYNTKMPIQHAKSMAEDLETEQHKPENEGPVLIRANPLKGSDAKPPKAAKPSDKKGKKGSE